MARMSKFLLSTTVALGASCLAFGDAQACLDRSKPSADVMDRSGVVDLTTLTKCSARYDPYPSAGKAGNKERIAAEGVPTPAIPHEVIVRYCFKKNTLQDGSLVLLNWCIDQQVIVPPGGNECVRASIPTLWNTTWFEDTCTGKQVEVPPEPAREALRLMKRNRVQPDEQASAGNSAFAEGR
jgi:hypothetical protein